MDKGLALKAEYQQAYCGIAADASCAAGEDTCAFQPYGSVELCESAVNVDFSGCPEIWEAMAEREDDIRACVDALETLSCGAEGLCDGEGASLLDLSECEVIGELQGLWCEGADTY